MMDNGPPLTITTSPISTGLAKNIYRAPTTCHRRDSTMKMIRQDAQTVLPPVE